MYNNCCPYAGLRFWKTGSRKIFAVKEEDIHRLRARGNGKRCPILLNLEDEDDDSDEFLRPARKRKLSNATHEAITDASVIMKDLAEIKKDLKSVLALTPESSKLLGLKRIMIETFQYSIPSGATRHLCKMLQTPSGLSVMCGYMVWR